MKTIADHINQLRQFLLEHPDLSNAPLNPDIEVQYDPERNAVVVQVLEAE